MKKNLKIIALLAFVFFIGVFVDRLLTSKLEDNRLTYQSFKSVRNAGTANRFTNPLLECSDIDNIPDVLVKNLKSEVNDYLDREIQNKNLSSVSVYFRDLNNGPWFGIKEKDNFIPGSLLKVPLMMTVYRVAMQNPEFLKQTTKYSGSNDFTQYYAPEHRIENGKKYTVEQLVEMMIIYSDNDAAETLVKLLDDAQLKESFLDLGIDPPVSDQYSMSVKTYASFFRILYNATFLNEEYSERALQLLSRTTFDGGITKDLPRHIVVSHKFGERESGDRLKQLHDCGIIYFPEKPYLLCVMSKGENMDRLSQATTEISKIVYDQLSKK